ncbi:MAG: class I SAM-dependent methyltransferase [Gaiellales bacterium]|jgi:2-polyprenyl-3-methyl-5-hydroxy-6-metoxy-1,4-benzoquinol methylase
MSTPEQRLSAFYELQAQDEPPHDPEAQLRFSRVLRAAGLRPGASLLDIGAKWGGLGDHARRAGLDIAYTGLELNQRNVDAAARLGLDVRLADADQPLPIPDAGYDVVVCLELLEHLTSPARLLVEVRRVLKPSGRAIVSVPNPYSWVEVYRELFRRPDPEGHLNTITTPVMENLFALAGLKVVQRLGTSVRIPRTQRLVPTNSIFARSRIFVARPDDSIRFAGRDV